MLLPLDHNFPQPILETLEPWMGDIQLIPLRAIDHRLPELDDRRLLIALKQLGYGGLVTLNYKMLRNPRELAAVLKTKMTIFAVEGVGHDPIRATGALLLDLRPAVNAMQEGNPGVFWLRPGHQSRRTRGTCSRSPPEDATKTRQASTKRSKSPTMR